MNETTPSDAMPSDEKVHRSIEFCFRERRREMILVLVRRFGYARLDEIEDALQHAAARALTVWKQNGMPPNPVAWLITVARNGIIDAARKQNTAHRKSADVVHLLYDTPATEPLWAGPLEDDVLKMMIVCTDPTLGQRESATIILRLVCNLSVDEIARGMLTSVAATRKQLTRAKSRIRELNIPLDLPASGEIEARIDRVLLSIYMLFNEGYLALQGSNLVRREFCREAERLVDLLLCTSLEDKGKVWALSALLSFQSSRISARISTEGCALSLAEQDRGIWDHEKIKAGLIALGKSMASPSRSRYHLEAAIAACHATARSYDETDWSRIAEYYEDLAALFPSPVVDLNRAVAIRMTKGAEAAIALLDSLDAEGSLKDNYLLPSLLGDFHLSLGNNKIARHYYEAALDLSITDPVETFLLGQVEACSDQRHQENPSPHWQRSTDTAKS